MKPLLPGSRVHRRHLSRRKRLQKGHAVIIAAVIALFLYGAYIFLKKDISRDTNKTRTNSNYIRQPVSVIEASKNSTETNVYVYFLNPQFSFLRNSNVELNDHDDTRSAG